MGRADVQLKNGANIEKWRGVQKIALQKGVYHDVETTTHFSQSLSGWRGSCMSLYIRGGGLRLEGLRGF